MLPIKLFLTGVYGIFCITSYSQDTTIYVNDYKMKLGIKISNEKSHYGFDTEGGYQLYSGGIQLITRINITRSSIETGIYLFPTASTYKKKYIYIDPFGNKFNHHFYFDVEYYYLTIPINYRIDTKAFYVSGGLFFNNLLFRYGEYLNYTDSIENYQTDRKFNWGWNLALGLEKHVSDHVNIFVEGKYVYTVSSFKTDGNFILNNNSLEASFTNYGISLGFNYIIQRQKNK